MVEKRNKAISVTDQSVAEMLTINRGMKQQKIHDLEEKIEEAKHKEDPLIIHVQKGEETKEKEKTTAGGGVKQKAQMYENQIKQQNVIGGTKQTQPPLQKQQQSLEQKPTINARQEKLSQLQNKAQEKPMAAREESVEKRNNQQTIDMKDELDKKESMIHKLKKELSSVKEDNELSHRKLKEEGTKIKNLQDNISILKSQVENMKKLTEQNKSTIAQYEQQLKDEKQQSNTKINGLNNELNRAKNEIEQLTIQGTNNIQSLKQKITNLQQQNEQYRTKMKELEKQLKESKAEKGNDEKRDQVILELKQEMNRNINSYDIQIRNYQSMLKEREEHIALLERCLKGVTAAKEKEPEIVFVKETTLIPQPQQEAIQSGSSSGETTTDTEESTASTTSEKEVSTQKKNKKDINWADLMSKDLWFNLFFQLSFVQYFQSLLSSYGYLDKFKDLYNSWYLTSFIAMLGPLGAYFASRYRLENRERAFGQALYFFVFPLNFLLWLDLTLVARRGTDLKGNFIPFIDKLPLLKWSIEKEDVTSSNKKKDNKLESKKEKAQ